MQKRERISLPFLILRIKTLLMYRIEERSIHPEDYLQIRATTSWRSFDRQVVEKALANDLYAVSVYHQDRLVGIGRVIGDGAIYFYIQDIIVIPGYQSRGVGTFIMEQIERFLKTAAPQHAFIGLMAAEGVLRFYQKFGYRPRPEDRPGMFKIMP